MIKAIVGGDWIRYTQGDIPVLYLATPAKRVYPGMSLQSYANHVVLTGTPKFSLELL